MLLESYGLVVCEIMDNFCHVCMQEFGCEQERDALRCLAKQLRKALLSCQQSVEWHLEDTDECGVTSRKSYKLAQSALGAMETVLKLK